MVRIEGKGISKRGKGKGREYREEEERGCMEVVGKRLKDHVRVCYVAVGHDVSAYQKECEALRKRFQKKDAFIHKLVVEKTIMQVRSYAQCNSLSKKQCLR